VDATQRGGFEFLGWHIERGYQWPREKSQAKFKETIHQLPPRKSGKSLREIVFRLHRSLKGWRAYFDHGSSDSIIAAQRNSQPTFTPGAAAARLRSCIATL
jgi:hypothetical protein